MATSRIKTVSGKLLSPTEREAISKLMGLHQPVLNEMAKWKEHREKLETSLLDQIDMIGKILKPYYDRSQETLVNLTRAKLKSTNSYPNKKSTSKRRALQKSLNLANPNLVNLNLLNPNLDLDS